MFCLPYCRGKNRKKLTKTAESELKFVIEKLVKDNQAKFVEFFNKAQPLTTRMHQIELLPGLGKKHMWEIIEERKVKPFKDFIATKDFIYCLPFKDKLPLSKKNQLVSA